MVLSSTCDLRDRATCLGVILIIVYYTVDPLMFRRNLVRFWLLPILLTALILTPEQIKSLSEWMRGQVKKTGRLIHTLKAVFQMLGCWTVLLMRKGIYLTSLIRNFTIGNWRCRNGLQITASPYKSQKLLLYCAVLLLYINFKLTAEMQTESNNLEDLFPRMAKMEDALQRQEEVNRLLSQQCKQMQTEYKALKNKCTLQEESLNSLKNRADHQQFLLDHLIKTVAESRDFIYCLYSKDMDTFLVKIVKMERFDPRTKKVLRQDIERSFVINFEGIWDGNTKISKASLMEDLAVAQEIMEANPEELIAAANLKKIAELINILAGDDTYTGEKHIDEKIFQNNASDLFRTPEYSHFEDGNNSEEEKDEEDDDPFRSPEFGYAHDLPENKWQSYFVESEEDDAKEFNHDPGPQVEVDPDFEI